MDIQLLTLINADPNQCLTSLEGCKFLDFSLISDFLRIKDTGIKLIEYG